MKRTTMLSLAAAALLSAGVAHAADIHWSIGIGLPPVGTVISNAPVYGVPVYAPPVAVYPPPVYAPPVAVYPAPVVYPPPRVVYAPPVVVQAPPVVYRAPRWGHAPRVVYEERHPGWRRH